METIKRVLCMVMAALSCVAAWGVDETQEEELLEFWVDGIHYRQTGNSFIYGYKEVMVCAPSEKGATYTFPLTKSGEAVIPATVNHEGVTYEVAVIGENTFNEMANLKSVTLPASIRIVEDNNFYNCPQLTALNLNRVNKLGDNCISKLANLEELLLPECGRLDIGIGCFNGLGIRTLELSVLFSANTLCISNCPNLEEIDLSDAICTNSNSGSIYSGGIGFDFAGGNPSLRRVKLPALLECYARCQLPLEGIDELWMPESHHLTRGFALNARKINKIYAPSVEPIDCWSVWMELSPHSEDLSMYYVGGVFLDYSNTTVYVPAGCKEAYRDHRSWKCFGDIREYDFAGIDAVAADAETEGFNVIDGRVESQSGQPVKVYDLSGRRVRNENLRAGIYIVRGGTQAAKIAVNN